VDEKTVAVPASFQDLLQLPLIAHLATVRADGSVQTNPMWFRWDGRRVRMTHTRTRKKYRNVQGEPRVALSIVDPGNSQRYLEVRGVVESIEDDPGARFYQSLREHYGSTGTPILDADVRVVLVIRPAVILGRSPGEGEGPPGTERSTAPAPA